MNNYFSHDSNARNDEKMIRLRMKHKATGYGIYFMILERMRDEEDYICARDYDMIAFDLREDAKLIKSVVEDFGLFEFTDDGKYFYSPSFIKRMKSKDGTSKARSESGRKGMEKRWHKEEEEEKGGAQKEEKKENDEDTLQQEKIVFLSSRTWQESVCMKFRLPMANLQPYIDEFFLDCRARGKLRHNNQQDAQAHFNDWLRKQLKQEKENGNNSTSAQAKQQRDESYASRIAQLLAEDQYSQHTNDS